MPSIDNLKHLHEVLEAHPEAALEHAKLFAELPPTTRLATMRRRKKRQGRVRAALKAVNRRHGKTLRALAKDGATSPDFRREVDALLSQDRKLLKRLAKK